MDLYCCKCGEPWDNDCIHEEVDSRYETGDTEASYAQVAAEFRSNGCAALSTAYGPIVCESNNSIESEYAAALYDLLGDDMDGAAVMLSDYFG